MKKEKANSNKETKKNQPVAKKEYKTVQQEFYFDMFTFTQMPVSEGYLLRFAQEWVEWATKDDDALIMNEWYLKKGISPKTVERWRARCPELEEAHHWAKAAIGARREKGALNKKLDSGMVRHTMAIYDKAWVDLEEWRAKLSEKIASSGGFKIIEVPKLADE